jgi:hypothetical protein
LRWCRWLYTGQCVSQAAETGLQHPELPFAQRPCNTHYQCWDFIWRWEVGEPAVIPDPAPHGVFAATHPGASGE